MKKDSRIYSGPLVSVVIPTYNGSKLIGRAVQSVYSQTFKNFEIVIVNDGSEDNTLNIISNLKARVIDNKKNLGFVKSLNIGIENSTGKYIARLDDDDIWIDSEKLGKQVRFMEENQDCVLSGGGIIKTDGRKEISRHLFPESDKDIRKKILVSNLFNHSAAMFKKKDWQETGRYDEEFGFFADYDLWLKLGGRGVFYNFQEYFVNYLDKEALGNYEERNRKIRRKLKLVIKLRNKHRKNYPGFIKSLGYCFSSYLYSYL